MRYNRDEQKGILCKMKKGVFLMSKNLQEYLQDNETVLWQGEPAAFPLIENGNKTRVLRTWLLTVVIIGGLLAAYVHEEQPEWSMNVAIGMVVIGAVIMISPVFERASVKRQKYYITNQRAILEFDARDLLLHGSVRH